MKKIELTNGMFAQVDDEDYSRLKNYTWFVIKPYKDILYAVRTPSRKLGKRKHILMHREILNAKEGEFVDHRNHNGLNNKKNNIRICTPAENMYNRRGSINKKTGSSFVGVTKRIRKGYISWEVNIGKNGHLNYVGMYYTERDAALAYNKAAKEMFGDFANLNKIR